MDPAPRVEPLRDDVLRATFRRGDAALPARDALALLRGDARFRDALTGLVAGAPFEAVYWETPPLTRATLGRDFELVLVDAPRLAARTPEPRAFAEHFRAGADVVAFDNLGRDARLVAPCPRGDPAAYAHLAAFARAAPPAQQHALWTRVADEVLARLSDRPLWTSTAGDGVAWLHVRLDARPKYYTHRPYRAAT